MNEKPVAAAPERGSTSGDARMTASAPFTRELVGGGLGVLGGMGPLAGATFVSRLALLTPARIDQHHIPVLLRNDPRIPARVPAHDGAGADPLPAMREGMRFLERAGVACIAVPCNTAHLWFDELQGAVSVPVLHIVQAVIDDLRRQGIRRGRVAVLGTTTTLGSGLYQRHLAAAGYEPVVPDGDELARHCTVAIAAVKAQRIDDAFAPAAAAIRAMAQRGVAAVVLGCTELPLAVPPGRRGEFDVALSDSIDALALAAIERFGAPAGAR